MMTYLIVVSMLAAGALGGLINFFLIDPKDESPLAWWKLVIVGIGASFMVPVFLNMISSQLITEIAGPEITPNVLSKLLILTGFCLIAAVSSRAFIRTLTDRVLRDVATAKEQSAKALETSIAAKEDVALVVEPELQEMPIGSADTVDQAAAEAFQDAERRRRQAQEPLPGSSGDGIGKSDAAEAAIAEPDFTSLGSQLALSPAESELLHALINSSFTFRSASGLMRDTKLTPSTVQYALNMLHLKGLVTLSINAGGKPRYTVTSSGHSAYWAERKARSSQDPDSEA